MNTHNARPARWHGRVAVIARAAWVALVSLTLVAMGLALPYYFEEAHTIVAPEGAVLSLQLTAADAAVLQQLGISKEAYALVPTLLIVLFGFVFTAVGVILFWRKSDDWFGLVTSFWLATFPASATPALEPLVKAQPAWHLPVSFLHSFGLGFFVLFTYVFPDGRFVPRWLRFLGFGWVAWLVISPLTPVFPAWGDVGLWYSLLVAMGLIGALALVYRYRRVSTLVQRQQTKWVVFGFSISPAMLTIFRVAPIVAPVLLQPGATKLLFTVVGLLFFVAVPICLIPITIGVSILRYRLWDIDILIRRTLIYGALTAILALFYLASVIALQGLIRALTGQGQSELVTVVSTLAIAALFFPLRARVQAIIDRHFYRRKYDAAKTLQAFSATVRDEVDLDTLRQNLLGVVEDTMQPAHVSLWLRQTDEKR